MFARQILLLACACSAFTTIQPRAPLRQSNTVVVAVTETPTYPSLFTTDLRSLCILYCVAHCQVCSNLLLFFLQPRQLLRKGFAKPARFLRKLVLVHA